MEFIQNSFFVKFIFYLCNAFVMLIRFYRYDSKDFVNG